MAKIPGVTTPGEVDIPKENGVVGDASQQKKGVVIVTLMSHGMRFLTS